MFGRVWSSRPDEFYTLCYALRETIMMNWQATAKTWLNKTLSSHLLPFYGVSPWKDAFE